MRRFDIAIRVLKDEINREVGKVALAYQKKNIDPILSIRSKRCETLKEAIKILTEHERNKSI